MFNIYIFKHHHQKELHLRLESTIQVNKFYQSYLQTGFFFKENPPYIINFVILFYCYIYLKKLDSETLFFYKD